MNDLRSRPGFKPFRMGGKRILPVLTKISPPLSAIGDQTSAIPHTKPTLFGMAKNITLDLAKSARSGGKPATPEQESARAIQCEGNGSDIPKCQHWNGAAYFGIGRCEICGCGKWKRKFATSTCPLGKWPIITPA